MDKYIQNLTDRQAEIEVNAEDNIKEIQAMSLILLNDTDKRSDFIFDSMVKSYVNKMIIDVSPEASLAIGLKIAEYMDMTFDELNMVPLIDRSDAWRVASSAMVTGASEQAKIMSGLTKQSMINGIENARDLEADTKDMSADELAEVSIDIKGTLKAKKDAKNNG